MFDRAISWALTRICDRLFPKATLTADETGEPFLHRYYVWRPKDDRAAVFVHHFVGSDPDRGPHNHPSRWQLSLILAGGYDEERVDPFGVRRLVRSQGSIVLTQHHEFHRVFVPPKGEAWTLFVRGRRALRWGFLLRPAVVREDTARLHKNEGRARPRNGAY